MRQHIPHPSNVKGDFYVEDGCCLMCEVPLHEAPDLLSVLEDKSHCFVKRQPVSHEDFDKMIDAMDASEVECIRYKGTDRAVQIRIVRINQGTLCDSLPADLKELSRQLERENVARRIAKQKNGSSLVYRFLRFFRWIT